MKRFLVVVMVLLWALAFGCSKECNVEYVVEGDAMQATVYTMFGDESDFADEGPLPVEFDYDLKSGDWCKVEIIAEVYDAGPTSITVTVLMSGKVKYRKYCSGTGYYMCDVGGSVSLPMEPIDL